MHDEPYLSIVATSRNDDHGGNLKLRMQLFVNCLLAQTERYRLKTELILVEWNPPADRPKLREILSFPEHHPFCSSRVIEVPPDIHARYRHAQVLPVYQMIAKNVGLRRARGRFVLATNVDVVFSDSLFASLASQDLFSGRCYRSIRHDVDNQLASGMRIEAVLDYCRDHLIRTNLRDYSLNMCDGSRHSVYAATLTEAQLGHPKLFTNACGDFTLLAREDWHRLRGYAECDMFSFHLDSLFLYCAHYAGIKEHVFPDDAVHYHIEHEEGWTPEIHRDRTMDARLDKGKIARLDNRTLWQLIGRIRDKQRSLVFNSAQWGLIDDPLPEEAVTVADWEEPESKESVCSAVKVDTCDNTGDTPYLSVVVTARNDDHGGNQLSRFQAFLDHLGDLCARHGLATELIVVEWNPDPARPRLTDTMRWPETSQLTTRIIVVPNEIHQGLRHADRFPLFQMIAKNVGIRRARGEYVLATNIDILFSDELAAWLARRELRADCFYRIDRYDIDATTIAPELSRDQVLDFCSRHIIRIHGQHGTYAPGTPLSSGDSERLHTNACGDFTLMARRQWERLKGYPEFELWSIYLDGLLLHAAGAVGLQQRILADPLRIYHIEHSLGWAVTHDTVAERPSLDYHKEYRPLCRQMLQTGKALDVNPPDWGMKDKMLTEFTMGEQVSDPVLSDPDVEKPQTVVSVEVAGGWVDRIALAENRLYYRDQSAQTIASLARYAHETDPTVIVELGTLAGLSLRTWIAATERTKIYAVDLSFKRLHETKSQLPLDLSRVTLVEQNILKTDFPGMWTAEDRVIFFVDAHDLPNVPVMEHVIKTALPFLPDGSLVVVDDLWFSEDRLTSENAHRFLETRVRGEIDELQCFEGHYAPYHRGGSFMGFAEVGPLLAFVNRCGIELMHDKGSKHVRFVWKKGYLSRYAGAMMEEGPEWGSVLYNPLTSVPVAPGLRDTMTHLADDYRQRKLKDVAESLSRLIGQHPQDQGLAYGLAVCLARVGMLTQARDVLAGHARCFEHRRSQQLFDDLVAHVGPCHTHELENAVLEPVKAGLTIFALPKPFKGHMAVIQRNAIRSWARLNPKPEIILVGDESGVREMAAEVGARHIPYVEHSEFGTPLVNKLFESAESQASHDVIAYVNADIILFPGFLEGVDEVRKNLSKFLLIGQRWDMTALDEIDFDRPDWQETLQQQMETHAMLHAECGLDYFVFPKGLYPEIPPFAIGRTAWDNWLVMTPHRLGIPVVDGTEFITAVHQEHAYGHVAGGQVEVWNGTEAMQNKALAGPIDNSAQTSGATRALRRDGALLEVPPRPPSYLTVLYRDYRSQWLLKQADRVFAVGHEELAVCKWNEAVSLLEILLAFKQARHPEAESLDPAELAGRYHAACLRLAQCYIQMGRPEQAVDTYTRLLENSRIRIPESQRDDIRRRRSEAERLPCKTELKTTMLAPALHSDDRQAAPPRAPLRVSPNEPRADRVPTLQAAVSAHLGEGDSPNQALVDLECKYRAMANGTRAKYAVAVRLSDLFRRAGLEEKSRALQLEAAVLKDIRCDRSVSPKTAHCHPVVADVPKVTIITACRNGEKWLPGCVDSILNQTMSQWQLFLLDDGSTDSTRRIIEEYAARDQRITAFYFDESAGPYVRRNYLIAQATTRFVMIHDADDIMCPEKVQRLYEAISADDRLGVVGSFYYNFLDEFEGVEHAEAMCLTTPHEEILHEYVTQQKWDFSSHGSAIIRRDLFGTVGFYDENPFGADSFWLAKVAEYAHRTGRVRLQNIPDFLTLRRLHGNSQTGLLPSVDPRGRRSKYRRYCLAKLRDVIKRVGENPGLNIAEELRRCTCGDFLTRFKAQIIAWEGEPLDDRVIPEYLQIAVRFFNDIHYVSCVNMLNNVESFEPTVAGRVVGYDLLRGMALYAVRLKEQSRTYVDREIRRHDHPGARAFKRDVLDSSDTIEVWQWCDDNARRYNLGLVLLDGSGSSEEVMCCDAAAKKTAAL